MSIACYILSACSQKLPEVKNTVPSDTQQQSSWSMVMIGNILMTSWNTSIIWSTTSMVVKTGDEWPIWNTKQTTSSETYPQVLDTWKWTAAGYEYEFWTVFWITKFEWIKKNKNYSQMNK